jgi:hypothetical protein
MQSPKFASKRADIEQVINAANLRSRWRRKVRDALRKQPIPDPIEHLDFELNIDGFSNSISAEVCSGQYIPRPPTRYLAEKSKGLCRQLVIPSPKDALVLQALSDALWTELRAKAPSKNSFYAPNDHRFSQIIRGYTDEYGPVSAWLAFQEKILGFVKSRKFIVITDIANYYDFISYDHLRNILSGQITVREHSLDLLVYTLSHMLWQPDYMPRVQIGLPQIPFLDAPRLLAHCFLFEIDELLLQRRRTDFARFMDDIDIGVDSIAAAKEVLRDLDLSLQTRQIRLNSGQTLILSETDARRHFRLRENQFLSQLEASIETKISRNISIARELRFIRTAIGRGLEARRFEGGNGDKILKRLINYARKFGSSIADEDFIRVLLKWPSNRAAMLQWWQQSVDPEAKLPLIRDFLRSSEIVDDATLIDVSTALVSARLPRNARTQRIVTGICEALDVTRPWSFYARTWILTKYGTASELMKLIESSVSLWVTEVQTSRLVGGLYPRFLGTREFPKYRSLINRAGNQWCREVFNFHDSLSQDRVSFAAVRRFIAAPNPSLPNNVSHPKFLMLRTVFKNPYAASALDGLRTTHAQALTDNYYKMIIPANQRKSAVPGPAGPRKAA